MNNSILTVLSGLEESDSQPGFRDYSEEEYYRQQEEQTAAFDKEDQEAVTVPDGEPVTEEA